jgi:hypothetical protein
MEIDIMFRNGYYLLLSALFAIISPMTISAQEEEHNSKFHDQIDSIVEKTLHRFDEELGTYIFRDEPSVNEDVEESRYADDDNSTSIYDDHTTKHMPLYTTTLSSFDNNRGVARNVFPIFPWESLDDNFLFRYNRVEGLFLGLNYPQKYYWEDRRITMFGSGGYGFADHRWRGGLGIAQQFGADNSIFEIGIEGHSLTDTRDQWLVGIGENNVAALLLRDDYRDYFGRAGFSVWSGWYKRWLRSDFQFQLAYLNDQYESLDRHTNWSVFGGNKIFRDNPSIPEGKMKSILTSIKFHSTQSRKIFTTGWSLAASAEVAGKSFGGDYDFNSYCIDIRRYQPISDYDVINIRLRAGSATGDVPMQKAFDLGGFSTIPAFRFKEFTGNRMLLANVEYVINGKMLDDVEFFPSWLLRNLNIILFADAGYVGSAKSTDTFTEGFSDINSKTIHSDWGFGIGTRDAKLRLGFAWRTDQSGPPMVFVRLNRPF